MSLSSYRIHKIYLAATMNYDLGSNDPEELTYYNKIRKEIDNMKKEKELLFSESIKVFTVIQNIK